MKKIVISLIAILGLSAAASAQTYVGVRAGYPDVGAHFGVWNAINASLGFRVSAGFDVFTGGGTTIEADVTYRLPVVGTPGLNAYIGAGPAINFFGNTTTFGIGFLAGVDFPIMATTSIFFEANPVYFLNVPAPFSFGAAAGLNFRF